MADTPISGLPDGGDVLTTDQLPVNRSGSNFRVVVGALAPLDNVTTARIANDAVTFAKMQNIATQTIMGRTTAATGDPEALTATQARGVMSVNEASTVPLISSEDTLSGQMQIAVVATLPGTPDANTIYMVTT